MRDTDPALLALREAQLRALADFVDAVEHPGKRGPEGPGDIYRYVIEKANAYVAALAAAEAPTWIGDDGQPISPYQKGYADARVGWMPEEDCISSGFVDTAEAAPLDVVKAAQRLIDYLDVREHHEDDTGIRRVRAASRPYVSDLRAALAATSREEAG